MRVSDWIIQHTGSPYDDLRDYAEEWIEAEATKRWAEEQLRLLVPSDSEASVGPYLIRRIGDSLTIESLPH